MNNQIHEFENFLPSSECDTIINWFDSVEKMPTNNSNLFNGRQINYLNIKDDNIKKLVNYYRFKVTQLAMKIFNEEELYPNYTDIVLWEPGGGMLVHSDNSNADGTPNFWAYRHYSGVLYLNDDFLGGETFFPDHGPLFIKPKKGKFAIYPSGVEYNHGVATVVGKNRYTMPIWLTKDKFHIED